MSDDIRQSAAIYRASGKSAVFQVPAAYSMGAVWMSTDLRFDSTVYVPEALAAAHTATFELL